MLVKYKKIEKRRTERKEEVASKRVKTGKFDIFVKCVFCHKQMSFFFFFAFLHKLKSQERHAMLEKDHVKPDGSTIDYEKNLVRIATRGGNNLYII